MALGLAALGAQAETSPWYVGGALGFSHESNIYRLADGVTAPAGTQRTDNVTTATLLGGLDQPIGRQHLFGSATLRNSRYANNSGLDNTGYGLRLGLDWSTIERLSGTLNLQANRELAFANPDNAVPTLLQRNIARTSQFDGAIRYGLVARWQAEATFGHRTLGYSAEEYRSREFNESWVSTGLRYRPSGALSLGVAVRQNQGRYPGFRALAGGGFAADTFRRHDIDLTGEWIASGASTLNLRLSGGRLRHSEASQRDYSGLTGELRWAWRPTGKLSISTALARETGQEFGASSTFLITGTDLSRTVNALRTQVGYELSSKINLNAGASYSRRLLADTVTTVIGSPFVTDGNDHTTAITLGARWTPTRSTQLSCDYSRERRGSDGHLSTPYGANVFGCVGQLTLQ
jgi:hypothetical protein